MIQEYFQYRGTKRKKLLNLLFSKYRLDENKLYSQRKQLTLFKKLIYHYFIYNDEINLSKLAKFYFKNKSYYFSSIEEQSLLSIVLRWETDVGISLINKINRESNINGKLITWECEGKIYTIRDWNNLHNEILYWALYNEDTYFHVAYDSEFFVENYLCLDYIYLNIKAFNQLRNIENVTLNYATITSNNSAIIWPRKARVIFNKLFFKNITIANLNFEECVYVGAIYLNNSQLYKGSLISPTDKKNNIEVFFNKPSTLELLKTIFSNKYLFQDITINEGTYLKSKELFDYYNWYEYYVFNFRNKNKISRIIDLIFTKYYTSISHLLLTSLFFIFFYAVLMYILNLNGEYFAFKDGIKKDFLSYLYMSLTNFTTLGFGEIYAKHWFSYLIIGIEVITGYFMLAMLVSIAAKREMKYS